MNDHQFETIIKVRDYETDSQGIVNNANYLHYLEITRHEFCEAAGAPFYVMQQKGLDPVVRRVEMDYLHSLTMGDVMRSCISLRREGARFIFDHDIWHAETGKHILHAVVVTVCLENGRLSKGDRLAECFAKYL